MSFLLSNIYLCACLTIEPQNSEVNLCFRKIQAFIYDASPLSYQVGIDQDCQLKIVGNWYARTGYSIGFPKGSIELTEEVNAILLELQEDGNYLHVHCTYIMGFIRNKNY